MAILFADSFNSYVSGANSTGGSVNAFDGLLRAGYEQPFLLAGVTGYSAGVLTNGGKQNNGAAARICWQNNSGNSALIYDPPLDAIGLKRIFSFHWERFICLSSQIRLTRVWAAPQVGTKIPVIVFGPVTVYASQTTVNGVAVYKLYANNSAQIGQIDSGSWPSIDIEINREQKKLRVWLANIKIWEADSDYFTTTSFEYVGMARKPNPDNVAVHVGTIDVDSVVIFDGSGTTNNERTISLAAKTFAADQVVESSFGYVGNANSLTNISSAFLLNDSLDLRYQNTVLPNARDLFKLSSTADSPPMGVSVTTVFKSIEADSQPVKFAYKFNEDAIAYKTPFLQAGGWRQRKVVFNSAPDGTDWAPDKVPQLAWGYEVSDTKEYTSLVNGAFEYLVFGTNDLFDMYRGDPDPTYVNPVKPEYVIPNVVIENSGPGSKTLTAGGTAQLGYFGTVESKLVFPQQTLAAMFPITEGTEVNAAPDWLKFANGGQVLFVAKSPLRKNVSWQTLYQAGLVYGVDGPGLSPLPVGSPVNQLRIVKSGGFKYRLRLLQGADTNPSAGTYNAGDPLGFRNSEYSRLYLRCSVSDPTSTFWERFSDVELGRTDGANTNLTWCKETHPFGTNTRVSRGAPDITGVTASVGTVADNGNTLVACWRPVLEYIGVDEDYVPPPTYVAPDLVYSKAISGTPSAGIDPTSPNYLFIPSQPIRSLKISDLTETELSAPSGSYSTAKMAVLSDDIIFLGGYGTPTYLSKNRGVSWTEVVASGYTEPAFELNGFIYVPTATRGTWQKWNLTMTSMLATVTGWANLGQFNAGCNKRVIVGSTSTSVNAVYLYCTWDMLTTKVYELSIGTNSVCTHLGSNVWHILNSSGTGVSRLLYIPPTVGTPVILKDLPSGTGRLLHVNNYLISQFNLTLKAKLLPARPDEPLASLATAQTYANEIETALADMTTFHTDPGPYNKQLIKAGNRLLFMTTTGAKVWDVH